MSDTADDTEQRASATDDEELFEEGSGGDGATHRPIGERVDVVRWLEYAALVGLSLLAVIVTLSAYFSASTAINVWVSGRFQPIFQTVFNLVVLGLIGVGISAIVRRRFGV